MLCSLSNGYSEYRALVRSMELTFKTEVGDVSDSSGDRQGGALQESSAGPASSALAAALPLTRKERRHRDTRREILEAARQLLLEVDPDELSLRQVARRADFSPASLYTYFASRDELVAALHADALGRLSEHMARVSAELPPDRRVVEYGMAYMDFARENPADLRGILLVNRRALPAEAGRADALETLARRTIQEAIESGAFADASDLSPAEMTYGIWALVHGMASLSVFNVSEATNQLVTAAPRRVLEAVVARLAAPAGEGRPR